MNKLIYRVEVPMTLPTFAPGPNGPVRTDHVPVVREVEVTVNLPAIEAVMGKRAVLNKRGRCVDGYVSVRRVAPEGAADGPG